jgi:hypothetical protein
MHRITVALLTLSALPAPEEIARLNECIQARFHDRKAFGMQRILPRQYHGIRTFQPENPTEQAVVNQLQRKGYQVALYLSGRGVLATPAIATFRNGVQGPAFITPFPRKDDLSLLDDSREALVSFEKGEGYDIRKGEWSVAMRPLRATDQQYVQCHSVKVGDAIGVAMYVYR